MKTDQFIQSNFSQVMKNVCNRQINLIDANRFTFQKSDIWLDFAASSWKAFILHAVALFAPRGCFLSVLHCIYIHCMLSVSHCFYLQKPDRDDANDDQDGVHDLSTNCFWLNGPKILRSEGFARHFCSTEGKKKHTGWNQTQNRPGHWNFSIFSRWPNWARCTWCDWKANKHYNTISKFSSLCTITFLLSELSRRHLLN